MIDSSGKTPAAFLEGTVTTLGDYDECLAIKGTTDEVGDIFGQYCMVDVFPMGYKNGRRRTDGQVSLNSMQFFNASAYYFGLCFPSQCSTDDVRNIVKEVLKPYPLMVEGDLHCDTLESISFTSHLKNIRVGPLISLIFLVIIVSLVAWSTFVDIVMPKRAKPINKSFSLLQNFHMLFYVSKKPSSRQDTIDWFKLMCITFGVFAHIMCCLESPLGFFVISE